MAKKCKKCPQCKTQKSVDDFSWNGKCSVCQNVVVKPHVDHCHKTGKLRGFLCNKCNTLLGLVGDSPNLAYVVADYLKYANIGSKIPCAPSPKKLLVTGASGLVGEALKKITPPGTVHLMGRQHCDLLRWSDVERMFDETRPTHVIHLAAKVGGVQANTRHPATFFLENATLNTHVLEACRQYSVKKVICFLSTCIFPDTCPLPLKPEYIHLGPPHQSNYGYAFAKRMLAVQSQAYNQEYGTNFVPVIPTNIYGPNDNFNLENSHVVPALIRKFWEAKQTNSSASVWGTGAPLREFVFSEDVADLLMKLLEFYDSTDPIIISTGENYSIAELARFVSSSMKFTGNICFDATKPDGQFSKPTDVSPLKKLFPDFKFTSLEQGIKKTVDWFAENWPNVRK